MEQAWSIFKGLITWPKRELIIAGPTPSVQEGLIFPSRMVTIGQEMVRENYSSRSGKSQRISLWVRENLSLWKKSRKSEIWRVHYGALWSWWRWWRFQRFLSHRRAQKSYTDLSLTLKFPLLCLFAFIFRCCCNFFKLMSTLMVTFSTPPPLPISSAFKIKYGGLCRIM